MEVMIELERNGKRYELTTLGDGQWQVWKLIPTLCCEESGYWYDRRKQIGSFCADDAGAELAGTAVIDRYERD